jgi:hypothetical protein
MKSWACTNKLRTFLKAQLHKQLQTNCKPVANNYEVEAIKHARRQANFAWRRDMKA